MNTTTSVAIMLASAFLAAVSQMLLKAEAIRPHRSAIHSYMNVRVIAAYAILVLTLFMNILAYTAIAYKYGAVINATSYTFALALSALCFKDKITWSAALGNVLIVTGIVVFALGRAS